MNDIKLSRNDVLIDCQRSMRYHMARAQHYHWLSRLIQFTVLTFSASGVLNPIHEFFSGQTLLWIFAIVSILTIAGLVFNLSDKHYLHGSLYSSFSIFAGEIESTPNADQETLSRWTSRLYLLYAKEPPTHRALSVVCANQVTVALGGDSDYMVKLTWFQRRFCNIFTFKNTDFQNERQRRQKELKKQNNSVHPDSVPTV